MTTLKDQGKRNEITTLGTVGSSRRDILYMNEYIYIIYIYIIKKKKKKKKPTGKNENGKNKDLSSLTRPYIYIIIIHTYTHLCNILSEDRVPQDMETKCSVGPV